MASVVWGSTSWWGPPPPAPARPLTDIDFCSGAQLQELTQLIQELGVQESWSQGPTAGPDLLQAKDFVFSLLGLVHRRDPRFPPQTELLLLRGGIREGSLDLGPAPLGPYARGPHYDAGFTLLVPVFSLEGSRPELQLDAQSSKAWLSLPELVDGTAVRETWQDCLGLPVPGEGGSVPRSQSQESSRGVQGSQKQPHDDITESGPQVSLAQPPGNVEGPESTQPAAKEPGSVDALQTQRADVTELAHCGSAPQPESESESREAWPTLCAAQVAAWFFASLATVAQALSPVPGAPRLVHAARHAGVTTILLATSGPPRRLLLFDLIPVVSVAGWPEGARSHSWAGPLASEPSFYLVPGCHSASAWHLCFARQELALKARVPAPLLQAHAAAQALLRPLVAGTRVPAPYLLRTLQYWACERLPALYLARPANAAACCLGLLDELGRVLETGALPHYFLGGCKLLAGQEAATLLTALAQLRGDPARALRGALEEAKAARKGGGLAGMRGGAH